MAKKANFSSPSKYVIQKNLKYSI